MGEFFWREFLSYWWQVLALAGRGFVSGMGWGWAWPIVLSPGAVRLLHYWWRGRRTRKERLVALWDASKATVLAVASVWCVALARAPYTIHTQQAATIADQADKLAKTKKATATRVESPRERANALADEIFGFLRAQEKTCPQWNNTECRTQVAALFQTIYAVRVKWAIEQMEARGIIGLHQLDTVCETTDAPEWVASCAAGIRKGAEGLPGP